MNIGAWVYSLVVFTRRKSTIHPNIYVWRRAILWLSGVYTVGCAFRSFLPRIDLERICLVDSWLSSMIVGRSVATVAEICFIAQCAILLREAGLGTETKTAIAVSWLLVPLIVIAEGFSWYAVISTNYLGSILEESLWTIGGVLLVVSFLALWSQVRNNQRKFLAVMVVFGIGFVIFMITVDVPMYWRRWMADATAGLQYLSLKEGIIDTAKSCIVSFEWQTWREEVPWMTLYFTAAVWVSLALPHAPNFKAAKKPLYTNG
ncbi:MAG: hypothetical protein PVH98_02815 [Gammaproteobacteria bacterium]|jgi:hypothetical protein